MGTRVGELGAVPSTGRSGAQARHSGAAKISAQGIAKEYILARTRERMLALRDLSLEVRPGEFVVILGPSGCGKSTFLRMVAGLDHPTSGTLTMDGAPITGPGAERCMLFQSYALFPWMTARQNVEFGPEARGVPPQEYRPRAQHFLELVGLKGFEDRYPHELSGGMQQRGALARLFANDPDVLLMDEPLAAADAQTRELLQEELLALWSAYRKTVLFVTHSAEEAVFLADRVVVMTRRPGTVKAIADIDLPRPRDQGTREAAAYYRLSAAVGKLVRAENVEAPGSA